MASNKYIKWTSINDLIHMLEDMKATYGGDGDIPVCINGISSIELEDLPYYYDGGYSALDANDDTNVVHSRNNTRMSDGFHKTRIDLRELSDDKGMKVNGRSVLEIEPGYWNWYIEQQQEERTEFHGQLIQYRLIKEKNEEMGCYPFEASVAFGKIDPDTKTIKYVLGRLTALGRTIAEAKKHLSSKYKEYNKLYIAQYIETR